MGVAPAPLVLPGIREPQAKMELLGPEVSQVLLAFRGPWVCQDLWGPPAPKEPLVYPDPKASWVMADLQDSKVNLDLRGKWAIQAPMVVWGPWVRRESEDPGVTLAQ